jgi:hypothetical protein
MAQPAQRLDLAGREFAVDVGEPTAEADLDAGQARASAGAGGAAGSVRSWWTRGSPMASRHGG